MADELPPNWEAVHDDEGRTYWWNVDTNETTWVKPQLVVATTSVAAGYLSSVKSDDSSTAPLSTKKLQKGGDPELEAARNKSSVGDLAAKFNRGCSTSSETAGSGRTTSQESLQSPPQLEGRSSATSVAALKKLQEARDFLQKTDEEKAKDIGSPPALPTALAPKPAPKRDIPDRPPKVDLYK
mmetsp:Transcript_26121/g.69711  ORF Transcript_26121/g.69711 Transcript_26121/m.69711 type:complete len:183 (-) Transcript_26121:348-896(-)